MAYHFDMDLTGKMEFLFPVEIVAPPEPSYDEAKIAVILLDENDSPTDDVLYVDALSEARTILSNSPSGSRYWVRMGNQNVALFIDNRAFGDYSNPQDRLRLFTMNSYVYTIYASAFQQCVSLKNIVLPHVGSLYSYVFGNCTSLESVDMSGCPTTSTGNGTFYYCTSLTEVKLPAGLTKIGSDAFKGCTSLSKLDIPSGVTTIGDDAFNGCTSLSELELPSGVTSIGNNAFNRTAFTKFVVPESVTSIGMGTFAYCSNLQEIEIPSGVTSINSLAFAGCTNLTKITINKPENSISGAPWGATNATVIWTG